MRRALLVALACLVPLAAARDGEATLVVEAWVELPAGSQPFPLELRVGDEIHRLPRTGRLQLDVGAGEHLLQPLVSAHVDGPGSIRLAAGETREVTFRISPRVELELKAEPAIVLTGETITLTARATADIDAYLPLDLEVILPDGFRAHGTTRLTAPLAASAPRELVVTATAWGRGPVEIRARAGAWGSAETRVTVMKPATLEVELRPVDTEAVAGEPFAFRATVANTGDEPAADVLLELPLPQGMSGTAVTERFDLAPGENRGARLEGMVDRDAPEVLSATARVGHEGAEGEEVIALSPPVTVLRPIARLERELDRAVALPGDRIEVELEVANRGTAPLAYRLADEAPEWLRTEGDTEFEGFLSPGEKARHSYGGVVDFGAPASGTFVARLDSNAGRKEQRTLLDRELVRLDLVLDRAAVRLGGVVDAVLAVVNPLPRTVEVGLRVEAVPETEIEGLVDAVVLRPGEAVELPIEILPGSMGTHRLELRAVAGGNAVAPPVVAEIEALEPLAPQRLSTLTLPFTIHAVAGDALLLGHALPRGARYEPGTSRLDGTPLDDPRVGGAAGSPVLYWRLPYVAAGELSYAVRHEEPLTDLADPAISLIADRQEIALEGDVSTAEWDLASPIAVGETGLILEPRAGVVIRDSDETGIVLEAPYPGSVRVAVNGETVPSAKLGRARYDEGGGVQRLEYFGVELEPGRNTISIVAGAVREERTVWLATAPRELGIVPGALVADGSTPLAFEIVALDPSGLESGFGAVTVEADVEPATPDALPREPGHQVLMRDGRAVLELAPLSSVRRVHVEARFNELEARGSFKPGGAGTRLYQAQGSVTLRLGRGGAAFGVAGRAYAETPLGPGTLQAALDTVAPLVSAEEPRDRFPLTGAGNEAAPALRSLDGVAARYDDDHLSLGYYQGRVEIPGITESFEATALRAALESDGGAATDVGAYGFVALLPRERITEELRPDGTRLYRLAHPIMPGSETVRRLVGSGPHQRTETLHRSVHYVLDPDAGLLVFAAPQWPTTPSLEPVRIEVTYSPRHAPRNLLAGGAGVRYESGAGWRLELGGMQKEETVLGARLSYSGPGSELRLGYEQAGDGGMSLGASAMLRGGPASAKVDFRYETPADAVALDASARVELGGNGRALARHLTDASRRETTLLLEADVTDAFTVGLGAAYDWIGGVPLAVGRAAWSERGLSAALEHRHPLRADPEGSTRLRLGAELLPGLELESGLEYVPGTGLQGSVDLIHAVGEGALSVGYRMAGTPGEANRARFGIDTPLPLDEHWSADLSARYERDMAGGGEAGGSAGLRYRGDGIVAAAAADLALVGWDPKLVLRGGASGTVGPGTSLSIDATLQLLPLASGSVTLAHAFRDGRQTLLSYHRLTLDDAPTIEGELAHTLHPDGFWQLRPAFAYRLPLERRERVTFQFSLGGSVTPLPGLAVGAQVHHQLQPGLGASHTAVGMEGGIEVQTGAWLHAGYTFMGFEGLTGQTDGFYLRLDLLASEQQ